MRSLERAGSRLLFLVAIGMWSGAPLAQTPAPAAATPADTAAKIQRLGDALNQARAQLQRTQAEIDQLQAQLQQLQSAIAPTAAPASAPPATLDQRVAAVEDQQAILQGKVDDQYQTKVASDSKFRVTLGGLLLMNLYGNTGTVENSDVPNLAFANPAGSNGGDFGATLRQSEITLRVAGPDLWGAQAGADLTADFFGGFPGSLDGTATGVARLKVARGHLDWTNTSLDFGLDTPLISPLSPTSYASLGTPALGYSGNLWTWTPQVWIEHRWQLGPAWHTALDAGIMDPLSGQFPVRDYVRVPEAGEASREPAFEARQSIGRELFGRDFTLGAGAYTSRQSYNFGRGVRAWAATADWNLAVASWLDLSGEIYRGRAIGGLWGGIGDSILASGALTSAATLIAPLRAEGGWAQLKWHLSPTLELNTTYGEDNPFAADLRLFPAVAAGNPLARNQTALVNLIDRPRSDLIFALEYRRLLTPTLDGPTPSDGHVNAAIGVIF